MDSLPASPAPVNSDVHDLFQWIAKPMHQRVNEHAILLRHLSRKMETWIKLHRDRPITASVCAEWCAFMLDEAEQFYLRRGGQ